MKIVAFKNLSLILFSFLVALPALSQKKELVKAQYDFTVFSPLKELNFFKKDSKYYISSLTSRSDLIISEEFKVFLEQWSDYKKRIDHSFLELFEFQPYFRDNYIFFSSPRRQVANAYATVEPFPFIHIYPSSATFFMDTLSLFSWTEDTLLHEISHIYQMSQNSKWDKLLWPFIGFFSHRNILLPVWILEGNAVFIESLYGSGGRLFSGFVRAFVFSQLNDLSLKRLLNPYDDSFSNLEKYLHGAYFFSYLHSQYGLEKIKELFSKSGRAFPLGFYGLNQALTKTFGRSLKFLFEEYKSYYKDLAQKHQSSSAPVLVKSKVYTPINSDKKSIYFLISDSKSPTELVVFDKQTETLTRTKKNLPIGKVFYKEGKYYSSASLKTSATSVEFSLFRENFKAIKKYNSQNIMDFYKDKAIAIDSRQSHSGHHLIVDKVFYNKVNSSVLADLKGNLYYFKQEGEYRTLYKNKTSLIQFKSYFSYPVEVNTREVYFIGATKYGSSLFVYKKGLGTYRLSSSSAIVSARKIKGSRFLVSEVSPTHYEYKLIETKEKLEQPVLYKYSFEKENIFTPLEPPIKKASSNHLKTFKKRDLQTKFSTNNLKAYKPLSQISLQNFFFLYRPKLIEAEKIKKLSELKIDHFFYSRFKFTDPLQFNELLVSNLWDKDRKSIGFDYSYKIYRPNFQLSFLYDERNLNWKDDEFLIETYKELGFLETEDIYLSIGPLHIKRDSYFQRDWNVSLSVSYPFYISSESSLIFKTGFGLGKKEFNKNDNWKDYVSQIGQLRYNFKRKYSQAYSYHKKREMALAYNFLSLSKDNSYLNTLGQLDLTEELGQEYFLNFKAKAFINLWNREPKIIQAKEGFVFYCFDLKQAFQSLDNTKELCSKENKQEIKNLYQGSIELLKVLNYSYYPLKVPFPLRRLAPLTGLSFFSAQDFSKSYRSFFIPFIGLEGDISFLHEKIVLKLGLALENKIELSQSYKDSKFQLSFWIKSRL